MDKARVFWTGRSQAVRLPRQYRIDAGEVRIRRHGNAIILEPLSDNWSWLEAVTRELDQDFMRAATEPLEPQQRPELEQLFE